MAGNSLFSDGAISLVANLRFCANLRVLDLSANFISEQDIATFGELLAQCTTLQALWLVDNLIDEDGCIRLAHELASNRGLRYIDLSGNSLTLDGAKVVREILPSTELSGHNDEERND